MVSEFISILDRLIKWKEYREKRIEDQYKEVFDPVYQEIEKIHLNYLQMFTKTLKLIETDGLYKARDYLIEARKEFEPIRTKIVAFNDSLSDRIDGIEGVERDFINTVKIYLESGYYDTTYFMPMCENKMQISMHLVQVLEGILEVNESGCANNTPEDEARKARITLYQAIDLVTINWKNLSGHHAKLRAKVFL